MISAHLSISDIEFSQVEKGKKQVMACYKMALKSLRNLNNEELKSGPHDYTEAAKGSLLYCIRMTAKECLLNKAGFWTQLFLIYCDGYWPCGLIEKKLVVY